MIARILVSSDLNSRIAESEKILEEHGLAKNHPDVLWIGDGEKLGVEQAKQIRAYLSLKPYSAKNRAVVLESAQNLTDEAQNSLLKTLEEPPESAVLILGADSENNFLPTILSRCQIVTIPTVMPSRQAGIHSKTEKGSSIEVEDDKKYTHDIAQLITSSVEQRFEYVEKLENKEVFLQALMVFSQQHLASHPGGVNLKFAKELLQAEEWSKANGNIRAILEYLMLKLPGNT